MNPIINNIEIDKISLSPQIEDLAIDVSKNIILPHFGAVHAEYKNDGSLLTKIDIQAHNKLSGQLVKLIDFKRLQPTMAQKLVSDPSYRSQRSFGASA